MPGALKPRSPWPRLLPGVPVLIAASLVAFRAPRDLDVDVPPGSPQGWAGALPATTPWKGSLLPISGGEEAGGSRTIQRREPSATSSRGALRVLTWDIELHLNWIGRGAPAETGRSSWEVPLPRAGSALYWVSLVPFLRHLLHPAAVFESELAAHLIELGRPVLAVVPAVTAEPALVGLARSVEAQITPAVDHSPSLLPSKGPRQAMFARFAFEQLLLTHPFDPDHPFAGKLLLFPEEAERWSRNYAGHGSASLRRGAIALLARLDTVEAQRSLLSHALSAQDPVIVHRALGALGRKRSVGDTQPMVEALGSSQGPERLAWIRALGRLRSREALPILLEAGASALELGSDELPAILEALALIPAADTEPVLDFAERVSRVAQTSRDRFRVQRAKSRVEADVPDPPAWRARCVEVLAVCLRARLRGEDSTPARCMFEWLGKPARRPPTGPWYQNKALTEVPVRARRFYIDSLRFLGGEGERALQKLADDPGLEPNLRLDALVALPREARSERCLQWLAGESEPLELRIGVVESLRGDPDRAWAGAMREQLSALTMDRGPLARRLVSEALAWLEAAGQLELADLADLFELLDDPRWVHGPFPVELRQDVRELIRLAGQSVSVEVLSRAVGELVERTLREGINPALTPSTAPGTRRYVQGQLATVPAHRADAGYLVLVEDLVCERLLGYGPHEPTENVPFRQRVPLEEQIVLVLGKLDDESTGPRLRELLENRRHVLRAQALLALGWKGERADLQRVATFLLDGDPFVRLCASEAASAIAGRELDVDWMFGKSEDRVAAAEEVLRWALRDR